MLNRIHCIFTICCDHIAFIDTFEELLLCSFQPLEIQSCLSGKLLQDCIHMIKVKIVNVLVKGIYPLDKFVVFVIEVKHFVYSWLLKLDAFLDDVDFVKVFEMHRSDLFHEVGPFGVPF